MTVDPNTLSMLYQIALVLAPLVLTFMHQRGVKLPIIESILNFVLGTPKPADPSTPNAPATPAGHPVLDALMAALKQRLGGATPTGFTLLPDAGNPSKVAVEFHTDPAK